jgi:hypothetical protein
MSLAVLAFQIANDESFLAKLARNFDEVLSQQGIQLNTAEKSSIKSAINQKGSFTFGEVIPNIEPWAIG